MKGIIMSALQGRTVILSITVLLIIFGISKIRQAPLGVFPEFSPVYVEVQTEALGLSAEEIEQILTVALEQDLLNGIAYLDEIWSESMPGLSRVVCVFEPGTDPMVARQVVAERLTQAHALPNVSKPPIMLQPYSSTSRIMKVGLSPVSPDLSLIDLSVLARWTIQPYLMGVEGVANVSIWGQRKRQLQVQVDPEILQKNGVQLQDVIKTTGEALWVSPLSYLNSSTPGTGGFFDTPNQRLGIRHLFPISTPEQLAEIPVHGHNLLLKDISTVVEGHQPLIGDAFVQGNEGLLLVIEKFPWASTGQVTENVENALDKLAPGLTGVAFDTEIYQPAKFVEAASDNLTKALGFGLILTIVMLLLFLYEWRTALISLISMSLSLLAGLTILYMQGTIFDMMIIAGFLAALGIIIDDAIVTVDHIRNRLDRVRNNGTEQTTARVVLEAAFEMRSPIFIGSLILLLVALPLFFTSGINGSFLQPFASSYLLALAASTLVALMVTPALSLVFLSTAKQVHRTSPVFSRISQAILSVNNRMIRKPIVAYASWGLIAIIGVLALVFINLKPGIPMPQERDLVIQWEGNYGASRSEMARLTKDAIAKLRTIPGVDNAAAHIGRAVMSDKVNNIHSGEIWLSIDEEADYDLALRSIQKVLDNYTEVNSNITSYLEQSINESSFGPDHLYAIRVFGENQGILTQKAEELQKAISNLSGIENVQVEYPPTEPTIEIEVDLDKARQYNIKPGDVRRAAATLVAGIEVGSLFEGQKVFGVVVWGVPEVRNSINSIKNLLVDTPEGGQVRVEDVAQVREKQNIAVIKRDKVSRYIDLSFSFTGNQITTLQEDIESSIQQIDFPLEYHAELVGNFTQIKEAKSLLWSVTIACLLGIFLLLQASFWSWRMAALVLPSLLVSLSGGFLVVWLSSGTLELGHIAGLLSVMGIAVYQSILLIKQFKRLELVEGKVFGPDLIRMGIERRLTPIVTTNIITAFAFLPFVILGKGAGFEMLHPMALVILGGLLTNLIINLFVLPSIYLGFGKMQEEAKEEEKEMLELEETIAAL